MLNKVDVAEAIRDRVFFKGRTPDNEDEAGEAFARLGRINNAEIFAGRWQGHSSWERHPNGDELVQVLEGETTMTLLTEGDGERHTLTAGQFIVVPAGVWHRFETPVGVTVMAATPGPTDHSTADDPRL
ncbi:MAG: cupin domain-containing protein [Minwuia sp.]|uniref:cupin domain-containing protein n=1 Tax=Minwuia sp. TaxID=2493630 RepID=UPI003A89E206